MSLSVKEKVAASLEAAAQRAVKLVLLVGGAGSGKSKIMRELAGANGYRLLNVKIELSSRLAALSPSEQEARLSETLSELIGSSPLTLLDNVEILFAFNNDPLPLLQKLASDHILLVSWNGSYDGRCLTYAEFGKADRIYESPDLLAIDVNGTATIDIH